MPWVTVDEFKAAIAADNDKRSPDDLGIQAGALTAALNSGKRDILDALEGAGYLTVQIEEGDRLFEYHLSQSNYHLYMRRVLTGGGDPKAFDYFNIAKQLAKGTLGWRVGGVLVFPGAGSTPEDAGGSVGFGMTGFGPVDEATRLRLEQLRNRYPAW